MSLLKNTKSLFSRTNLGRFRATRSFSSTKAIYSENTEKSIRDFPWLLSKDKPRISKYPYETEEAGPLMNILPVSIQHALSKWVGSRILQLNTGLDYFPDQFMVGASLATRKALQLLSNQLNYGSKEEIQPEVETIFGPALLHRYMNSAPTNANISIELPQIYDVNVEDVWVTLGNSEAFAGNKKYDTFRWMTLQVGLIRSSNEEEESFDEHKQRIKASIIEGIQVYVDVTVDADVVYHAVEKETNNILLHDEGRRNIRIRFATPYFQPARKMVSRRDPETGYPENDWSWRIVDVDQLIEKESMNESV
ncbi:hypothetical protein G6F57_006490 [Rhizopus arrhizus]|nr:hypothetical protein G6F24_006564 [Rhizopus arrhizus]KAG0811024.1 hypothetical protein G6F20_007489 [Rhizopus arrhizus]KAG0853386.1 hypothetical protein G6F17_007270 [Rhizopus arrhizus]KAG0871601.1 hypothetical protein G6F16_005776 [Rhizopus arrhizus]KAG0882001.1 hypothetical protein G6F15_007241 [Rhizopus arrhizus]